ncbi:MAG: extracellular solute-binding protein [Phascolarctobacterium sp.]|mgnify:FL=1|nr:extracellular solute-binding protein [Phascolarctobacterium sp.]
MKKLFLFCVLCFALILTGCGNNSSKLNPNNPVTLNMWHVYGSQTKSPLNDAIQRFNETEGKQRGVIVKVVSVSNSSAIDKALLASAAKEPGSVPMPDLFTAYPRIMTKLDTKLLLPWEKYLSKDDLAIYRSDFLKEGNYKEHLYMLPIAKSTELLFVNQTFMDRFLKANNLTQAKLSDYDTLFALCQRYYQWSGGKQMFQINDFYHYFLTNMAALGEDFVQKGKPNFTSEKFKRIYRPMAEAAIAGGLCTEKGYASDRWKTGEVISNVGSTAGILYLRNYVTHADNSREAITTSFLPSPSFKEAADKKILLQRGTGLFALQNKDERKNQAAAVFAKWIGRKDNNLSFVTKAGYLPVNKESMEALMAKPEQVEHKKYRQLYKVLQTVENKGSYLPLPLYAKAGENQAKLEKNIKLILTQAHQEYAKKVSSGQASQAVLDQLVQDSLTKLQTSMD